MQRGLTDAFTFMFLRASCDAALAPVWVELDGDFVSDQDLDAM